MVRVQRLRRSDRLMSSSHTSRSISPAHVMALMTYISTARRYVCLRAVDMSTQTFYIVVHVDMYVYVECFMSSLSIVIIIHIYKPRRNVQVAYLFFVNCLTCLQDRTALKRCSYMIIDNLPDYPACHNEIKDVGN